MVKRIKSLLWRAGMMGVATVLAFIAENVGILEFSPTITAVVGLVFGEISKMLNTRVTT